MFWRKLQCNLSHFILQRNLWALAQSDWRLFKLQELVSSDMVSFETSFDLKKPKLEPKLVSALSETKRLFLLFCFYTETESFDVSIEPKQTEDQPKQFDREHILLFFTVNWGVFRFFRFFCFLRFFRFVSKQFVSVVSLLYQNREFRCFDWTETNRIPTQTV
jgi:hypothetical protein